jgi:hypothetical protein
MAASIGQVYMRISTGQLYGLMTIVKLIDSQEKFVQILSMAGELVIVSYDDFFSNQYQEMINLSDLTGLINGIESMAGNAALVSNFNSNYEVGE